MEDKLLEKVDEKIQHILDEDINTTNLEYLYKLSKIKHMTKEDKEMNYGARRPGYDTYGRNYGEGYGNYGEYNYGNYGNYGANYGRRGRDMRYRGEDEMDRMYSDYGRYQESRSRYGAGEETDKSFHYMVKSLEDFIKVLYEEAQGPQQQQMLRETLQRSIM